MEIQEYPESKLERRKKKRILLTTTTTSIVFAFKLLNIKLVLDLCKCEDAESPFYRHKQKTEIIKYKRVCDFSLLFKTSSLKDIKKNPPF